MAIEEDMRKRFAKPLFIIAGNHTQYKQWVKNRPDRLSSKTMIYVEGPQTLVGRRDISGYFVGSFRDRDDLEDIIIRLAISNSKSIGYYCELLKRK